LEGMMKEALPMQLPMLIDGHAVSSDSVLPVRDPGRLDDVVGLVAQGTALHVDKAVGAALVAFRSWRKVATAQRVQLLLAAAEKLDAMAPDLAVTLVREQGMLLKETQRDVRNGARALREAAGMAEAFLQAEQYEDDEALVRVEKVPRGVVAALVPWNAPMGLAMGKVGPALATGNTIVVKPSEFAPLGVSLALMAVAACLPPGVLNVLHGDAQVGAALVRHPQVRKISFTGGTRTGRAVMAAAAETIKNIGLELGGNDPAIILDDADPNVVVPEIVKGVFPRSGQVCYAIKRVYVPRKLMSTVVDAFVDIVGRYRVGHGLDPRATFGPVNNRPQFDIVRGLIERSRQAGAKVHELGTVLDPDSWNNGFYMLPTVVVGLDAGAELVVSEQFGPVVPLVAYDNLNQALQMANDTEFGLASSIWTGDPERGLELASQIEAGVTFVNSHGRTSLGDRHMPFGGIKQSGIGRVRTQVGLSEYIEYHAISMRRKASGERA